MATKAPRPGRTLLIFGLSIALLYGLAALGGSWKPKLGLDLEGGTRITLSADTSKGGVTQTKLKQAAAIVNQRVNGSGVSEAEVSTQGNRNIIVEIPGKNAGALVETAKRTAQLRFRLVAAAAGPTPTPSASPSAIPSGIPSASPSAGATGSPSAAPSASPSASTGASPAKTPKATPRPTPSATSTPKGRPAPFAGPSPSATAGGTKKPRKGASPSARPSASPVAPSPTAPATTAKGASVDDPLSWVLNPGESYLTKFAAYSCPTTKKSAVAPVDDDPNKPLVTCDAQGTKYLLSKAAIEGTSLKKASYGIPQGSANYVVNLSLKGSAIKTFATISRVQNSRGSGPGSQFAIVLDGKVIEASGFREPIVDGSAEIQGNFTEASAKSLSNSLKYGALPLKFDSTTETVGPSLAGDQLGAAKLAGFFGLLVVMIAAMIYYRGLGSVVVASLLIAAAITYAVVLVLAKAAGFTLTLPGIAGLIVAVGITADSFIVYFERIRDEMREGRSMRVAVESGWVRARNTCLAADAVSLLAAVVLYVFAIGVVRGFAFALGVSTLIDLVVVFFFTKPVMTLLARRRFFNSGNRLSGLSSETLGVDGPRTAGGRA